MPLTKAQIAVLRHATEFSVWEDPRVPDEKARPYHQFMPYKGAPASKIVGVLRSKGWLDASGRITQSGRGKLLTDPVASSELPS